MWALWVVGGLVVWLVVALLLAIVVGRGIRMADQRSPGTGVDVVLTTADVPGLTAAPQTSARSVRTARRRIPLPPMGIALAALAVGLEICGFFTRLSGSSGTVAHVLSMDAPLSLPRMYVATLFAAAALVAVAGAGNIAGRRTWWAATGLVAGVIAAIKAGSTVHADALNWLSNTVGPVAALLLSVLLAAAVVATLWFLSRAERRDRRRVLSSLAGYAVAAVALSAVSSVVSGAYGGGSSWAAGATFVEESGEALAGVAFLIAVLAGVAPRLVLPAAWPLRRTADAHALDIPEQLPGRAAVRDVR